MRLIDRRLGLVFCGFLLLFTRGACPRGLAAGRPAAASSAPTPAPSR